MHVLYSFRRCPYAMRARLALRASGLPYEHREVALKDKPAEMLLASPKGTVPVLCLTTGEVLEQSYDIMCWALKQNDPNRWLPQTSQDWEEAQNLLALNDGEFKANLDRYKYPQRFDLPNGMFHRDEGAKWLLTLDELLKKQSFLSGDRWGLVDACIAPFVRQFARTDRVWFDAQPWSRLRQWLVEFESSEAFTVVMQKYPLWKS